MVPAMNLTKDGTRTAQVWICLKKGLSEEATNEVRRMNLTKDGTAAIFDVPKAKVKEFLALKEKWTVTTPAPLASLSLVTGDHSANHVPPLRTVHLDSRSVVGVETLWASSLDQTSPPLE
eukprot:1720193-Pyramimonas_sp.AAC.1